MSDTWMVLPKEKTQKTIRVIDDEYENEINKSETCFLCYETDCKLIGLYGTWNEFGSFKGVCEECLKKLNKLNKKTITNEEVTKNESNNK